jgi:formate hydrogenlyase subunit 3/multisubunit Na+/H+ antiporter MnhD subunit
MSSLIETNGVVLLISLAIQLLSVIACAVKNERKMALVSNSFLLLGLSIGVIYTLNLLLSPFQYEKEPLIVAGNFIRLDGLSLFFLFVIQLVSIPITIFNLSYLNHYIETKRSIKAFLIFYALILIFTQLVVVANQAIFFLVCWETMSISAYLAISLEKEKEEVQRGSFYYLATSHVLIFFLYIFFFLLHNETGSWFFNDYHLSFANNAVVTVIFIASFIGFGIKAGLMPFHFWLPQAHPVAPSVISAFLSGVLIKTAIYGLLRTYLFLKPVPEWCGWLLLIIGMVSAILGVWYALAQHDIKRLLAYHSIENIGIIVMGIGIGFIGSANNLPALQFLGFGGALLHTLNHAIFKSLLFIGSGIIYQNLGTRNIEAMGGLVHRAKFLSVFFLIGSVAISGIPPFNGFISEFLVYLGFFSTAGEFKGYYLIIMLLFVVGLAFVGGLAVACFTKVNSIMFLGTERVKVKKFHVSLLDYISMGLLASFCIIIGFFPQFFINIIQNVLGSNFFSDTSSSVLMNIDWLQFTLIFSTISFFVIAGYYAKVKIEKRYGRRINDAWGCGYENLNSRMQYTASSFADELNTIPQAVLLYKKEVEVSDNAYPKEAHLVTHSSDFIDNKIIIPGYKLLRKIAEIFTFTNQTDLRYYIGYILLSIIFYSCIAFLWD